MTNEELVAMIQNGEREKLQVLWEQVKHFVVAQARATAAKTKTQRGVTAEDLYQSGYFALLSAVETFSSDAGGSFLGWLSFYLKKEFAQWGGWANNKQRKEPLNSSISLDAPVGDTADNETTLGELQPDPDSSQAFDDAEKAMWNSQLRTALEKALDQIPNTQAETIRRRYFQGDTLKAVGTAMGISTERARQLEENGLQALRAPGVFEPLEAFLEAKTPYYLHVNYRRYKSSQTSAVEEIVFIRERLRSHFNTKIVKGDITWMQKTN